jgi:hypothetical protein
MPFSSAIQQQIPEGQSLERRIDLVFLLLQFRNRLTPQEANIPVDISYCQMER